MIKQEAHDEPPSKYWKILTLPTIWLWSPTATNTCRKKTSCLRNYAQQIGPKINQKKTELIILNITNPLPIRVNGEDLPITKEFTYLGRIVRHDEVGNGISKHLNKAKNAFRILYNIWRSQQYRIKTKLRLYQSCVVNHTSVRPRMLENDSKRLYQAISLPHKELEKN